MRFSKLRLPFSVASAAQPVVITRPDQKMWVCVSNFDVHVCLLSIFIVFISTLFATLEASVVVVVLLPPMRRVQPNYFSSPRCGGKALYIRTAQYMYSTPDRELGKCEIMTGKFSPLRVTPLSDRPLLGFANADVVSTVSAV